MKKWKTELSSGQKTFLYIILILLFAFGTFFQISSTKETGLYVVGILLQTVSFAFTALPVFLCKREISTPDFSPNDYFTDRRESILKVFERMISICEETTSDNIICIKCKDEKGIGKTEFIHMLWSLLNSKADFKKYLSADEYKKYKKIFHYVGKIHVIDYIPRKMNKRLNSISRTFRKRDVFLIDNFALQNELDRKPSDIVLLIQSDNNYIKDSNRFIEIKNFSKEEIEEYYMQIYKTPIDQALLLKIMDYSKGNISQIANIFESESTIELFVNNTNDLFNIEMEMKTGNYSKAHELLNVYKTCIQSKSRPVQYKAKFLEADLFHLENKYKEADNILVAMQAEYIDDRFKGEEIIKKIAHIKKHTSEFEVALGCLSRLPNKIRAERSISTEIMAYSHREKDCFFNSFIQDLDIIEESFEEPFKQESFLTYVAVRDIYRKDFREATKHIDSAIDFYKDHRRIYNCYFIKGEIYRHSGDYKNAYRMYEKCIMGYKFNGDFDLYAMGAMLIEYLNIVDNAKYDYDRIYDVEKCIKKSLSIESKYMAEIGVKIKELKQNKKNNRDSIIKYFDKYVFLIP